MGPRARPGGLSSEHHAVSFAQAVGDVGMLCREAVSLPRIGGEVVEVFARAAAQEFPLAFADGGLGGPAPHQGVVRWRLDFPSEVRQEIHTVEVARFGLDARHRGGGGGDVQADNGMLINLSPGDGAFPMGEPGNADAALAEHTFFAVHWFVERAVPAARVAVERGVHLVNLERRAVVAHEKEERAFLQVVLA